jgi:uncharacterized protein (TIGR02217 family)
MAAPTIIETPRLPDDISRGAHRSPDWSTVVVRTRSGFEQAISEYDDPLHTYDISYAIRTVEQYETLLNFWYNVGGRANGFRFKDWADYSVPSTAPELMVELTATTFQIVKRRTSGALTYVRNIYKPVSGTVRIWNAAVEITTGFTVATTTGIVTFSADPGYSPAASFDFDVPVKFANDRLPTVHHDITYFEIEPTPLYEMRA